MHTDILAKGRFLPLSSQKVRRLADLVRGRSALEAVTLLKFTPSGASQPMIKVLDAAMANAEENFGVSRDNLVVYRITADEAPMRKWRRFGARGRFKPWLRRSSHITIVLREAE
jgi:large subunit ribosomal protein L22